MRVSGVNLFTWYTNRELDFVPQHFVFSQTLYYPTSKSWVLESLVGRFAITKTDPHLAQFKTPSDLVFDGNHSNEYRIGFEDPKEAVFYDLVWS